MQAASVDGRVAVYDLAVNQDAPVDILDVSGLDEPIWATAFSPGDSSARWLAVGSVDLVSVYRMRRSMLSAVGGFQADAATLQRCVGQA